MARVISAPTPGAGYDDGIYQADTREMPAPRFSREDIPAYCCRLAGVGRSQRCRRTVMVDHLVALFEEIERERARQKRIRNDWRARNLAGWIAFAERRLAHYLNTWVLPERAGDEADRFAEPVWDRDAALPACTC